MRLMTTLVAAGLLALLPACGDDDSATPGTLGNPCFPNDTCSDSLECLSGVCVDLHSSCGNGTCEHWETETSCGLDCGDTVCGDDNCDPDETYESCPDDCPDPSACGDNAVGPNEACDGDELDGETCETQGFVEGTLACAADCLAFDTSGCTMAQCGDDIIEEDEVCDGSTLAGATCDSEASLSEGDLACSSNCLSYDTSGCYECGNASVEGPEVCDATLLAGATCATESSFSDGYLGCTGDCLAFDTSGCYTCGDGQLDGPEFCDGANLGGLDCYSLGMYGGTLACGGDCLSFDVSACTSACDIPNDCSYCNECAQTTTCFTQSNACSTSADCMNVAMCVGNCGDSTCVDGCVAADPIGGPLYAAFYDCVFCTECYAECGAPAFWTCP